jgi:hypothetical protein
MRPSSFLSLARAKATNGARARAHLVIVAVAARSYSYRRVRLDLTLVVEWLGRFVVSFLKRAQRAPHAATNRARVRAHLLMIAVAAQRVSVRVHIFRLTYMCVCVLCRIVVGGASAEAFVGAWLQRLSCRCRACCVLFYEIFVLSLSLARAQATNGARARAHLVIVAVAARSYSYRRVRLDLASVVEWLDRFAVPFLKRAQRAPHAATNRARVRTFVPKSPS